MKLNALLDIEMVALHQDEKLASLIEITAPPAPAGERRQPLVLVAVLDRSGSMAGPRLQHAQRALCDIVDRLAADDHFGLVTFDDEVHVPVPAANVADKAAVKHAISAVLPGGTTDLAAGYLRGLQEARRVAGPEGATVLLVSDGHANRGLTDPEALGSIAATSATTRVTTSALGMGLGYDERLLSAVARSGRGNELFAEDADTAAALIAGELDGLLSQTVQAASLLVRLSPQVKAVQLINETTAAMTDDGLLVELGGFYADESRKLVLNFAVPGMAGLGLAQIAELELRYVDMTDLSEQVVTIPLNVNVVPGDQAAGRIADATVRTEVAYQHAQAAKRRATQRLIAGEHDRALEELSQARGIVDSAMMAAPPAAQADLAEEAASLDAMSEEARYGDVSRASKRLSADVSHKSRNRGRRRP